MMFVTMKQWSCVNVRCPEVETFAKKSKVNHHDDDDDDGDVVPHRRHHHHHHHYYYFKNSLTNASSIHVQCESKKVARLKHFAIFSLLMNLCN